jgi:hypothetical protein
MTRRYRGSFITANPPIPAGSFQNSVAGGVWSMAYQAQYRQANLWPLAGNVADGTFAIFALGCGGGSSRNKYTYSGDVNSSATASTGNTFGGSAAGNTVFGIFALGNSNTTRNKYTYSGDVNGSATASTASSDFGSATGNSTVGIFALGSSPSLSTTRNKYTYSGDVVSTGAAASQASGFGSAVGNSTVGIFALGYVSSSPSTIRNKYTYSSCTSASATSTCTANYSSAAGNSTFGIFAMGKPFCYCGTATRQKYTYSGDTVTSATNATQFNYGGAAAGNSVVGIFALGLIRCSYCSCCGYWYYSGTAIRNKVTYSGCVVSAATSASASSWAGAAVSNGNIGVNT